MNAKEQAQRRWDHVAKPLNSLGKLEKLIIQIAGVQNTPDVHIDKRCALVFCADHGVVAEGVSQSGSEVTALVAKSIADGTANINLMAGVSHTDVFAVDMGMLNAVPCTIDRRIAAGTQNMAQGPAMTRTQVEQAIQAGVALVGEMKTRGYQLIATGEMGIGNTTASTAIACMLLECAPEVLTGRGAGLSDAGLLRKREAITRALNINQPDPSDPLDVLAKVGGFEIAGMTGAFLGGIQHGVPIIIDGVISAVAALAAARICPAAADVMLPSHMSREPAMVRIMEELGVEPILHADMALGEGTGAVALLPLLDMALQVYHGPHTFDDLGMAAYTPQEEQA
ncbi:MAG: nicotinate-nucleotide--dimethylbenzimidazole phosphoribosyltransferase [Clostridia bacterium]|nr:nicotinate-nucleotide--dimethylbenzimidazole phosphoribosyltransferase [Clostridia bacterium]MBQ8557130.1 nicotinate-nucleotide--dimethylbenzimidazole phosphoribosyltransferase [Clostridia bacterium]